MVQQHRHVQPHSEPIPNPLPIGPDDDCLDCSEWHHERDHLSNLHAHCLDDGCDNVREGDFRTHTVTVFAPPARSMVAKR